MTSRERAGEVVITYFGKKWSQERASDPSGTFLFSLVQRAIDAAVAAEREAVAVSVENEFNTGDSVLDIVAYIRARGEK